MLFFYGTDNNWIDVTNICLNYLVLHNTIIIPSGDDSRSFYFSDPVRNIVKKIAILLGNQKYIIDDTYVIKYNLITELLIVENDNDITNKVNKIHDQLIFKHGSLKDEFPEQKMAARYLVGGEKVLEIGGNIGRNSLIIASIIGGNNLVSMESDINSAKMLQENRDLNNFNFHIEPSALSKRKLIQNQWITKPSNILEPGHFWVNIITYNELLDKYKINFDTLVLDCEGAFYYILLDMPEILSNIKLIIMENDYEYIEQKLFVDKMLINSNFYREYKEDLLSPYKPNFFEVWRQIIKN